MKSEFFSMFGIPPTECEIEARKDELGVPRLWFRSTGNPLVGLDLTGATQLQHLLTDAGEANQANESGFRAGAETVCLSEHDADGSNVAGIDLLV
jgi:hypothetical protein